MPDLQEQHPSGDEFAAEGLDQMDERATKFCRHARARIELFNKPAVLVHRARGAYLARQERELEEHIDFLGGHDQGAIQGDRALYHWIIAGCLALSSYVLVVFTIEPYGYGWKAWVLVLGPVLGALYFVERVLEDWASPRLVRTLETLGAVTALLGLSLLAAIRTDLFDMRQRASSAPALVLETDEPAPVNNGNDFYQKTGGLMAAAMVCLTLVCDVGTGCAAYQARRCRPLGGNVEALKKRLATVRQDKISEAEQLTLLEEEGGVFEEKFWRDYERRKQHSANGNTGRMLIVFLALSLLPALRARAENSLNVVVAVDLTKSVAAVGPDHNSEFDKNLSATARLVAILPTGTTISIIGITDQSFSQPYVLLSAHITSDGGYFNERLASAHTELLNAWRRRRRDLSSDSRQTDLVGAMMLSSQFFRRDGRRNVLVILSDMRQFTEALDLEQPSSIDANESLGAVERQGAIPDLKGVEVYVLGADAAGKTLSYWEELRNFWAGYFSKAGATLQGYSVLRQVPQLSRGH